MVRLTKAQADLLERMGDRPNVLVNFDEVSPEWWIEGERGGVRNATAKNLIARGYVQFTGHQGGQPGILFFTRTEAGRAAISERGK